VNVQQDIVSFANKLPRAPASSPILIVRRPGVDESHSDFNVRREKVRDALRWLQAHNPYYKDVVIDEEVGALSFLFLLLLVFLGAAVLTASSLRFSLLDFIIMSQVLENLPFSGSVEGELNTDHLTAPDGSEGSSADLGPSSSEDSEVPEVECYMPVVAPAQNEDAAIRVAAGAPVAWPSQAEQPLNEFTTVGLAAQCFPTLFPDGKGDPTNPERLSQVTETEGFKHLLKFADILPAPAAAAAGSAAAAAASADDVAAASSGLFHYRFGCHPRFRHWVRDRIERHRILSQSRVYLRQNPEDGAMTVDELQNLVSSSTAASLVAKMSRYVANITGSGPYWYQRRRELEAIFEQEVRLKLHYTIHLFYDRAAVLRHNYGALAKLGNPIAKIEARHTGSKARHAAPDQARGLEPEIYLAEGAKVQLTCNITGMATAGLMNGAGGVVRHIIYAGQDVPPALPRAVMIHFPDYTGPDFDESMPKVLPVVPAGLQAVLRKTPAASTATAGRRYRSGSHGPAPSIKCRAAASIRRLWTWGTRRWRPASLSWHSAA
jgi:hypothetical protein